ncbi:type I restriction endonuclease subunit R [Roseburia sp. MSJ-14]|uniref:type I restriction endonuclease subunit R n=1 Tax=Roseburia sp. MSJ-14 TaxID=2841514 RepID=UPI001C112AAC|nr:HsdR family type I site-specific deoxyribonuclease [Roseburia sp. MSJ-14]MBU5473358.1 HsdR family type I site-specific deoxyribonuclease [Roseburia sp. MSJ-14]
MSQINTPERITQNHVLRFFSDKTKLNYTYIGNLHDHENTNIMQERLHAWLISRGYSDRLADGAIDRLQRTANDLSQGLYYANQQVYSLLKYGAKVNDENGQPVTVYFIDFEEPENNDFAVAEEVTVVMANTKRPDVVVYINGIAVVVLELKKSTISVSDGIRQNLTNQREHYIDRFFATIQYCMAGNTSEGLRYGTLLTPEKKYLEWKEDGYAFHLEELSANDLSIAQVCNSLDEKLDQQLYAMFQKTRFLDLIHNFIIFDKGRKKVCRYNQYYAIKRAQSRLTHKKQGGIIWHTQGSGKSLTMVWLSKWILANDPNARVLIITDREELDDQIEKLFIGVGEKIIRTKSGDDLIKRLDKIEDRLICSLVHKFGKHGTDTSEKDYEKYVEDLLAALPSDFSAKGNITVFVDECHRTQSGKLHKAMEAILPKAIFIGFTGTPLLKKDKQTSLEVFGGYIHTYKFDEGVRDGVILDLRYEARDIPQDITSQDRIDAWFDAKTVGLMPRAKARLKAHWGNLQKVFSSRSRLEKIANDIIFDFETKARLMDGAGNAILVAGSVYAACKYYEIFQSKGFRKCAIISSYVPQPGDLRTDTVSDDEDTETFEKYSTYLRMIGVNPDEDKANIAKKVEEFETEAKRKFVDEPANMKLLIVVDKLLTGFDAPPCTYLYIDKAMHDHGLFQAICRVNRLDDETKDFGYIVDYKQLFGDLAEAMNKYTSGAFEAFDAEDVEGLLKDRTTEAKNYFEETLDALDELCEGVDAPREELQYIHYFCGESGVDLEADEAFARAREKMYKLTSRLVRAYAELKPRMDEAGYSVEQQEKRDTRVNFYVALKETIGRASGDFIDLKAYEPGMRYLIDNYITAEEARKIGMFDDFTLLDFILTQADTFTDDSPKSTKESAAETIENNIRRKVVERITINPAYYAKMSEVLENLILDRRKGVLAYKELLARYVELAKNVTMPEDSDRYPKSIRKSGALRSLYDNCGEDEELALKLDKAIRSKKQDGFRYNPVKENRIKRELYKVLGDEDEVDRIYMLVVEQEEY